MRRRSGFVLAFVLLLIPVCFILATTLLTMSSQEVWFSSLETRHNRLFMLAESGLNVGFYNLAACNFNARTHGGADGSTPLQDGDPRLMTVTTPGFVRQADGWYEWRWRPGDAPDESFTGTGKDESIRFKVYATSNRTWAVEAAARLGNRRMVQRLEGTVQGAFQYAMFDAGNLSEFVRGANQTVEGKVHANGHIYLRPSASTLNMKVDSLTAAGRIVRFEDAWGRPDAGGNVYVSSGNRSGPLVVMPGLSQGSQYDGEGKAFDSAHPQWTSSSNGALSRWGGVVKDSALGTNVINPPAVRSLEPGGYYENRAGLVIRANTADTPWMTTRTFYNAAEDRLVTVKEIDVSKLGPSSDWPANGLIYASTAVRLVNADALPGPMTLASNSTIYTRGDFNKKHPTQADENSDRSQPAALMTTDRIYHLSGGYNDVQTRPSGNTPPTANEPPRWGGDESNVLEINAALVDGAPTVDELNYVDEYNGEVNTNQDSGDAVANSDDLLENWANGKTIRKRGSIVHLHNARMANFSNSNLGPGVTPWIVRSYYSAPNRDYQHDDRFVGLVDLEQLSGNAAAPPFSPNLGKKTYWQIISEE